MGWDEVWEYKDIDLLPVKQNRTRNIFPFPAYHTFPCSQHLQFCQQPDQAWALDWLQRNLCSTPWSTSAFSFFSTHMGVSRVVSSSFFLPFFFKSLPSPSCCVAFLPFPKYIVTGVPPVSLLGSALACAGCVLELCLTQRQSHLFSHSSCTVAKSCHTNLIKYSQIK